MKKVLLTILLFVIAMLGVVTVASSDPADVGHVGSDDGIECNFGWVGSDNALTFVPATGGVING